LGAHRVNWTDKLKAGLTRRKLRPKLAITPGNRVDIGRPPAPPLIPRFQLSASDQITRRTSVRSSDLRRKLRAVFTPAQPVWDPRNFAGRTDVLTALIRAIEDQRLHVVVYGERGIGKTSLLHIMTQVAREARYIVVYSSCGAGSNFSDVFRTIAEEVPLLFHSGFAPTDAETEEGGSLADLLPEGPLSPRHISELFVNLVGTRLIVVLDEFDRIESGEFRQNIAELIKNLSDRSVRVQLVIAGVAENLTELVQHIPSIRRNILALQVPRMDQDEVRQLVRIGEEATGITFEEEASQLITAVAFGSPYLASLLSHHAGLAAIDADRMQVDIEDVRHAIRQAGEELGGRISLLPRMQIDQAAADGKLVGLAALAGASLLGSGHFEIRELNAIAADERYADQYLAFAEELCERGKLIGSQKDEFGRRFHFLEESVPVYLWLHLSRGEVEGASRLRLPVSL
jgi:Cdc6-like AAA superfamily ATPase